LNGVHDGNFSAAPCQRGLKLQQTAGISGGDDIHIQWRDELRFSIAQGVCRVRLDQIIDTGGTAANRRFRNFH
jgi:hypothetical protein